MFFSDRPRRPPSPNTKILSDRGEHPWFCGLVFGRRVACPPAPQPLTHPTGPWLSPRDQGLSYLADELGPAAAALAPASAKSRIFSDPAQAILARNVEPETAPAGGLNIGLEAAGGHPRGSPRFRSRPPLLHEGACVAFCHGISQRAAARFGQSQPMILGFCGCLRA